MIKRLNGFDDTISLKKTSSQNEESIIKEVEVQTEIDKPKENSKKTTSTFKLYSEMNDEEREVHDGTQEEGAKASGSWC